MRITEILFREGLKKGVEAFLAGGKAEGFSTEQMFTALLKIIGKDFEYNAALLNKVLDNLRHAENEDLSSPEMDEPEYFSMMKKVLNKKYGRKIPSQRCLIIAFDILYTIHEKEYVDVEDFYQRLEDNFGLEPKNTRVRVLGSSPYRLYSGLMAFTSRYLSRNDYNDWKDMNEFERLKALERAENIMYKELIAEKRKTQ